MQNRSFMPVPGTIVKLDPMAIPSRNKYGLDKLGVGEAIFFDQSIVKEKTLRGSMGSAKRLAWGVGKKFKFRSDPVNKRYMIARTK